MGSVTFRPTGPKTWKATYDKLGKALRPVLPRVGTMPDLLKPKPSTHPLNWYPEGQDRRRP